jgi:TRAP-type transport system periplasmic protein
MIVTDNIDKTAFVKALAPVEAQFEKDFGKANLDRIRNYK